MEAKDSKAQIEVWEWKEKVSAALNMLPESERIDYIVKKTAPIIAKLKLKKANRQALIK